MLGPSRAAPDYDEQVKKYKEDPSSWGTPASVVDMMKSPQNVPQPGSPQADAGKDRK